MKGIERKTAAPHQSSFDQAWWDKTISSLVRWRYFVFLSVLLMIFAIELIEHILIQMYSEQVHIYFDAVFYALVMPIIVWIMLVLLEKTESARARAVYDLDQGSQFSQSLGEAADWDSLVARIVQFPNHFIPRSSSTLFVLNPVSQRMEAEAYCSQAGQVELHPNININPDSLPVGSLPQLLMQNSEPFFNNQAGVEPRLPPHRYDLPITRSDQQLAVLKIQFPENHTPSAEEIRVMKSMVPTIALALEGALLQNMAADQAATSELQRQQIAQNLHDTLAQNVGYLRLKLDQLTGENAIREIGVVLQELERMRATAEEAFQQVRNTLDQLNPIQADDLVSVVTKQAEIISRRAGFRLRISQIGTPANLPPNMRQQILYIAREALHNIEKHACAEQATLQFLWLNGELILKISDDGVGFDPRYVNNEGHYGLWIMQHRAQEIGGSLKINAAETGHGTEVTLWLPITVPVPVAA